MQFSVGQAVMMPCEDVSPGAFSGESLVTIEFQGERISGFVRSQFVVGKTVRGTIINVTADNVTVKLPGSFFTRAAGRTTMPSDWASAHLQPAPV